MKNFISKIERFYSRIPSKFLDAGIVFLFACLYFWPYLTMQKSMVAYDLMANIEPWASHSDLAYKNFLMSDVIKQRVPWVTLYRNSWLSGEIPFWNPFASGGMPFLANHMSEVFYPLNTLFLFLPLDAGFTIFSLLHKFLTGFGMYLFLRKLDLHRYSALVGAVTWMFSGFLTLWLPWLHRIATVTWIPWALFLVEKVARHGKWRDVGLLAISIALIFLGGHIQFVYYGFLTISFYGLWRFAILEKPLRQRIRILAMLGTGGLIGLAVTAVQLLPTLELSGRITRSATPIQNIMAAGLPPENLLMLVVPKIFGDANQFNVRGNFAEFGGYMGVLTLALFIAAVFYPGWRNNRTVLFFPLLVAISMLLIHGSRLNLLMQYVPGYTMFQTVFRLLSIWCFAASGLAAIGVEAILIAKGVRRVLLGAIGASGIMVGGLLIIKRAPVVYRTERYLDLPAFGSAEPFVWAAAMILAAGLVILLLTLGRNRGKRIRFALYLLPLLLVSIDMLKFSHEYLPVTDIPEIFPTAPSIAYLQENRDAGRVTRFRSRFLGSPLPPNLAVVYELEDFDAYDSFSIRQYAQLIGAVEPRRFEQSAFFNQMYGFEEIDSLRSPLMNLLRIAFLLTEQEIPELDEEARANDPVRWEKVFRDKGVIVYRNQDALSLAGVYGQVRVAESNADLLSIIASGNFDPAREIWLTEVPKSDIDPDATGFVEIMSRTYNTLSLRVKVNANNSRSGILMIAQNNFPGWRAEIDGSPVEIFPVYTTWQGLIVPNGSHEVALTFIPSGFGAAATMSIVALLLATGLIFVGRQQPGD